jgi:hypothetical protein
MEPDPLRSPEALLAAQPGGRAPHPDYSAPIVGLTRAEATALAQAAGGRLPDEGETDRLLRGHVTGAEGLPPTLPVWTSAVWSQWSYRMVMPLPWKPYWHAPAGRHLPDADPMGPFCLFIAGPPVRRLPSVQGQAAGCLIVHDAPQVG